MHVRTVEAVSHSLASGHSDQRTYTFVKEDTTWYIDLPSFLEQGGDKEDLRLRAGTNRLLKMLAGKKRRVTVTIDTEDFKGAEVLELVAHCAAPRGGAIYLMETGREASVLIWICDIALFVFGDMPARIYFRNAGAACTRTNERSARRLLERSALAEV
jgi:hypothetical protein